MQSPFVVSTYRTWPTTPRIARAPWSQGVPLTCYVIGKGIQLQDASDLTTGRAAWQQGQIRQRGHGIDGSQRSRAMVKACANRPAQKVDRLVNRKMRRLRHKMTPDSFTGKLTAGAALGGAAAVVPAAFLGALTAKAFEYFRLQNQLRHMMEPSQQLASSKRPPPLSAAENQARTDALFSKKSSLGSAFPPPPKTQTQSSKQRTLTNNWNTSSTRLDRIWMRPSAPAMLRR